MSVVTAPIFNEYDLAPLPVYRFSVQQYRRLGELCVLTEDDDVELLEGWIVRKMNHNPRHDAAVDLADDAIRAHLPPGWRVRIQSAVTTADSEPEPDLAIVRGSARQYSQQHPQPNDIALIIEVADSSLPRDRFKCRLYGRAKVSSYWIINLVDSLVEAYTEPSALDEPPSYRRRVDYRPDQTVPLLIQGQEVAQIPVRDLLP